MVICIGKKNETATSCRHHNKNKKLPKLNRKNTRIVFPFDELLLSNKNKWLADDAIEYALELIRAAKSYNKQVSLGILCNNNPRKNICNENAEYFIDIVLKMNHWLVVTNIKFKIIKDRFETNELDQSQFEECDLFVYDTSISYNRISNLSYSVWSNQFNLNIKKVGVKNVMQQSNPNDCGVLALCNARDLFNKVDPLYANFIHPRQHVMQNLINIKFSQCPRKNYRPKFSHFIYNISD